MLGEYGEVGEGWGEGGERGGEGDVECQALWGDCGHVFVNATYYISSSPFINLSPSHHLSHHAALTRLHHFLLLFAYLK